VVALVPFLGPRLQVAAGVEGGCWGSLSRKYVSFCFVFYKFLFAFDSYLLRCDPYLALVILPIPAVQEVHFQSSLQ
jgi:hypothetical protein